VSERVLLLARGSPVLDADRRFLERWSAAEARPAEVVLVPAASRQGGLSTIAWPGLSIAPASDERGFFGIASERLAASSCEWVVFSLGEGALLPEKLPLLGSILERAAGAWGCWISEDAPEGGGELGAVHALGDVPRAPHAESLLLRRDRLVEIGGLEEAHDALAPWASFLALGEHGPVRLWREGISESLVPRDARSDLRSLLALGLQARLMGELSAAQALALVTLGVRQVSGSRSALHGGASELLTGYYLALEELVRTGALDALVFREKLLDVWHAERRDGPTRIDLPLWPVDPGGTSISSGSFAVPLRGAGPTVLREARALTVRRGSPRVDETGRLRFSGRSWAEASFHVEPGKLCRVRIHAESLRRLNLRFSWDERASLVQLRLPFHGRFRARVGGETARLVELSTDDDRVVFDWATVAHPALPPVERWIACPAARLAVGVYSDDERADFAIERIELTPFEHEGLLAPEGSAYVLAGTPADGAR
jgi:hypothetical protein